MPRGRHEPPSGRALQAARHAGTAVAGVVRGGDAAGLPRGCRRGAGDCRGGGASAGGAARGDGPGFRAAAAAGCGAPGRSRTTEPRRRPCPGTPRGIQARHGGGASAGRERRRGMTPLPPMRTGPPGPRRRREGGHGADPAVRPWSRGPWIPARSSGPPRSWCLGVLSQQAGKGPALAGLWSIKSGSVPDRGTRPAGGHRGRAGTTPVIEHVWLHSPDCNREVQALP